MLGSVAVNRLMQMGFASRAALRIALFYVLVAAAWIYFSDMILSSALPNDLVSRMQTIKGTFFVLVTGTLLFGLIRSSFRREMALRDSRTESQHRWRELVEHTNDAVIILDGRRIIYANAATAILIGASDPDALIGHDIDAFLSTGNVGRVARRISAVARGGEMPSRPFRIRRLDGAERTVEAHSTSIRLNHRPVVLSILVDITQRLEQEQMLMRAKDEAEQLAQMKTCILNNMSHEIRTPLTGILGISEALSAEVSGEARELTTLLQDSAWRLMRTLESVLTLAQLDSDTVTFSKRPVDIVDASTKIVRTFEPRAREKEIRLAIVAPERPIVAEVDPAAFDQVLMNLVSNAIKFTHRGGVSVKLDADDDGAYVHVEDTGVGIAESFLPYVFEEYRQESQGISRDFEGTGLGLTIVKRLLDRMGGDITIDSERGVGTSVRARLPLASTVPVQDRRTILQR